MGSIFSTSTGLAFNASLRSPRNEHLIKETSTRAELMLKSVAMEEEHAFTVHSVYCAYYRRKKNGRACTCRDSSISKNINDAAKSTFVDISAIPLTIPQVNPQTNSCPICLDTGFAGGYDRLGCSTFVFDPSSEFTLHKVTLDNTQRPFCFRPTNELGFISFKWKIPKYYDEILDAVLLIDDLPSLYKVTISGTTVGGTKVEDEVISHNNIRSLANTEVELKIYCQRNAVSSNSNSGSVEEKIGIYGLVFVLKQTNDYLVPADFPNLTRSHSANFSTVNEIESPQSVFFDRSIGKASNTDLFLDTRWYGLWRVVQFELNAPFADDRAHIIDVRTQSRLVTGTEAHLFIPNRLLQNSYPAARQIYLL